MVMDEVVKEDIFSGEKAKLVYWTGTASNGVPVSVEVLRLIIRATFHLFLLN